MTLSIRWRLTLWHTLSTAAVLIVFAVIVYWSLRRAFITQVDRNLESAFGQLLNDRKLANETEPRMLHWVEELQDHLNVLSVVTVDDGQEFARSTGEANRGLPKSAGDRGPSTIELANLGRFRVIRRTLQAGSRTFDVSLFASLAIVDDDLALIRFVIAACLPVGLLLSGGVGYWLARRALTPIIRIRRSTDEITADHLDQRLPVENPDDELGRLARTINNMLARLERSFSEIRRFTADASHELRTPLTALRTEIDVALQKPLDSEQHRDLLASLLEELERMSRLTDQLLTLSRRDAGVDHFALEPVDLRPFIETIVDALRPMADERGISLTIEGDAVVPILGDQDRLRQVFINLIDNALKYTCEGGSVRMRLDASEDGGTVVVEDTGIGIAEEHRPYVFDRFYRVDKARSRSVGGTGLGLSIARSVVQLHDGRISLSSEFGVGTRCEVFLPNRAPKANG